MGALAPRRAALGLALDITVFVVAVGIALCATILWFRDGGRLDAGGVACVALVIVVSRFPLVLIHRSGDIVIGFETCVLVFLGLVHPPLTAFVMWAIGTTIASGTQRKAWRSRIFNVGITVLGGVLFLLALSASDPAADDRPRQLGAVLIACGLYFVFDLVVTSWSLALEDGSTITAVLQGSSVVLGLACFMAVNTLGYFAAMLATDEPRWTLLLLMVPVSTMLVGIRSISQNRIAQRRLTGLLEAATSAPDWADEELIEQSLVLQTQRTLGKPGVAVRDTPAVLPEIGAPIEVDGRPTTHLIVTPSSPYHEFTVHDQAALETLTAMGAAAFQRRRLIDETTRSARHDALTGLYNRSVFVDHLSQELGNTAGPGRVSVLYCDLDGFKEVNDRFGHDVGDQLLVLVSRRLEQCIRDGDLAARFGGDEFGVLVGHHADEGIADVIAERVHEAVMAPYQIDGRGIQVEVSVGIATSQNDVTTAEELIDAADLAMYAAKARGKARVERFVQSMRDAARSRLELEAALRDAVLEDHIRVHYQPVVCLRTGRIEGFEALARWNHPRFGSVGPETFIAAAERVGVIRSLGIQVLERAHEGTRQLARAAGRSLTLGVNVSAAQVSDPELAERVGELTAIGPEVKLLLELTEGLLIEDNAATIQALHRFKSLGVTLALDDFGMGYSSIGYLDRLPVDVLKVDKLFVSRLHDRRSRALVEGIVAMAQALDLTVIAEGVEDWRSATILRDLHCGLGQGFVFGPPMQLTDALAFVSAGDRDVTAMSSPAVGHRRVTQS